MRLDAYLFEKGLAESRSRAKAIICGGTVFVDGRCILKPSYETDDTHNIEIIGEVLPYVSRGGLKLKGAIDSFGIDFSGLTVCDVGASTGGFTDCALAHGAAKVYAIDSGRGQLHPKIAEDERVISFEGLNAKKLTPELLGGLCDAAVCDVSFISQIKLYKAVCGILKDGAFFVSLIKPQFEAGRENIGKGGIIKDRSIHKKVIENIIAEAAKENLFAKALCVSPIEGGDGNREYLMLFEYNGNGDISVNENDINGVVNG